MRIKKLFGIKKKEKKNKIKLYFLGLPIWKVVIKNTKIKIYFCGIRVFSFAKPNEIQYITKYIEKDNSEYITLKAFELLDQRKNCFYE